MSKQTKLDNPSAWGLLALLAGLAIQYADWRPGIYPALPEVGAVIAEAGAAVILLTALALRVASHVPGAGVRLDLALVALARSWGDWSDARAWLRPRLADDAHRRWLAGLAAELRRECLAALRSEHPENLVVTEKREYTVLWDGQLQRRVREVRIPVFTVAAQIDIATDTVTLRPVYLHGFNPRSRDAWRRLIASHTDALAGSRGGRAVVGLGLDPDILIVSFAPPVEEAAPVEALPEPEPEPEAPALDLDSPVVPGGPPLALLTPPKRGQGGQGEGKTAASALLKALERIRKPCEQVGPPIIGPGTVTVVLRPGEVVTENRDGSAKREPVRATDVMSAQREIGIALGVGDAGVRLYADPTAPGCIAVEVPRSSREGVSFREAVAAPEFREAAKKYALPICLGRDVRGRVVTADLAAAPHILGAGTTGSGKSVAINALICSLLTCRTPEQVRLFILDPKQVDFVGYSGLPHLAAPILVEADHGVAVLDWLVQEMERRYTLLRGCGVNNIAKLPPDKALPRIVFVADEFADLLMAAESAGGKEGKEARAALERSIARIAQKARAAGIHLILATQRPSADIVTGLIKSNIPSRLALRVNDVRNSQIILDQPGAEALAGKGDALWSAGGAAPVRVQSSFPDPDIPALVAWWKQRIPDPPPPLWTPGMAAPVPAGAGADEEPEEPEEEAAEEVEEVVEEEEDGITL